MPLNAWIMLVTLSIVWGGSFFFNAVLLAELSPFGVVFGRVLIGCLVLYAVLRMQGLTLALARHWRAFLAMGFLNNFIPFTLIASGQTFIDSGLASIFNATTPLFGAILAFFLVRDENVTGKKLVGVVLGVAGVAVLFGIGSANPAGPDTLTGGAMVMLASLSYAIAGLFWRRFPTIPPPVAACGMQLASSLMCLPLAAYHDGARFLHLSAGGVASLLGIGVLCSAFGFILYFQVLRTAGAVNVLLVTLLIPVSASLLGALFLGEAITAVEIAGMAVIGLGLLVVDGRLPALLHRRLTGGGN
ncbi:DMT family transporter [Shumkonia mesophila]|uniref:DMT family transporter n=1 Tax=Shumkonia mesophila TaxID=2838854 RepID=UPI002934EA89|nr:DMT family transporter [Shumkonia mesophila]